MNLTMKYIVVKTGAILFNENTTHSQVAAGFKEDEVYSAGFASINSSTGDVKCYGNSESLKKNSIPEKDSVIIQDLFNPISQVKYFAFDIGKYYSDITN